MYAMSAAHRTLPRTEEDMFRVKMGLYTDADAALRSKLEVDRNLGLESRVVFE